MKRGFTLIELITVIVILGLIASIALPAINKVLKRSKEQLYNSQVQMIQTTAKKWGIENIDELSETEKVYLDLQELLSEGYIEQSELKDPRNANKTMNGCIVIEYNKSYNKYDYTYYEKACAEYP